MNCGDSNSKNEDKLERNKALLVLPLNILQEAADEFSKEKKFSDKILMKLYSIFGSAFEKASEIYESGHVTHISTSDLPIKSDTRYLLRVKGSSGQIYTLFPNVNFCTCKAFRYQVLEGQTAFTCKHFLASWLALIDKEKLIYEKLTTSQFRGLLLYQVSYKQHDEYSQ